jgi:hypothetical protein
MMIGNICWRTRVEGKEQSIHQLEQYVGAAREDTQQPVTKLLKEL